MSLTSFQYFRFLATIFAAVKGTVMQIEKALINDRSRVPKGS